MEVPEGIYYDTSFKLYYPEGSNFTTSPFTFLPKSPKVQTRISFLRGHSNVQFSGRIAGGGQRSLVPISSPTPTGRGFLWDSFPDTDSGELYR